MQLVLQGKMEARVAAVSAGGVVGVGGGVNSEAGRRSIWSKLQRY